MDLRRRCLERFARHGPGHAQRFIAIRHGGRSASDLQAEKLDRGVHDRARGFSDKALIG